MENKVQDFRGLGDADILGFALDGGQRVGAESESQDLLQAGVRARAEASQLRHEAMIGMETEGGPGHAGLQGHPDADTLNTQEVDSQLRRLPIDSEPQPDFQPLHQHQHQQLTHISATQSAMQGSVGFADHTDILDSAALDMELLALPLETQDPDTGSEVEVTIAAGPPTAVAGPSAAAQLLGSGSVGLGDGGMYTSSQALDDALRAMPVGSSFEDDLQLPPPQEDASGAAGIGPQASAAAPPPFSDGGAGPGDPPTELQQDALQPSLHPPLQQHLPQGGEAYGRPAQSSWGDFDDYGGGGSFDDDLEDYLAAQAAEEAAPSYQPPPGLQPPDLDELDDLIAELENGGRAGPSTTAAAAAADLTSAGATMTGQSRLGAMATAGVFRAVVTGTAGTAPRQADRSQETVQQEGAQRQVKRPRTEARGRPTMEELFGSDEEDAAPRADAARSGRATDGAGRKLRDAEAEETEEESLPMRPAYFPPQRLASSIHDGIALPVTAASGERVYCRMAKGREDAEPRGLTKAAAQLPGGAGRRRGRSCLLGMPLADMLRELEDRQLRAAIASSDREEQRRQAQLQRQRQLGEQMTEEEMAFAGVLEEGAAARPEAGAAPRGRGGRRASGAAGRDPLADGLGLEEAMLWVDKYAPRHFMSLLSDERTNRQVALWVKDWDECVFGRGGAASGADGRSKAAAAARRVDSRPQHKVLLIGGPPGLGKTTLAHVVARHCGYHPYEINASDDRTAATLLTKIQDAVQMTAVLGGGRPNCVIVDEVDGATGGSETGGAVAALLKLVRAGEGGAAGGGRGGGNGKTAGNDDEGSNGEGEAAEGKKATAVGGAKRRGGSKKGSQQRPLCRPIICICNDLYAPALRPLRDVARVFHFSPPASERLTARLAHICQAEKLEVDPAALRLLVERTDRDVRACLNTLQFLARRGAAAATAAPGSSGGSARRTIDVKDIESLNIASKDTTQSAMDMWTLLFSTGTQRRQRGGSAGLGSGGSANQLSDLCNRLQDFGDYDLVLNGVHENLPRARFMDINFSRTAAVEDAMGLADVFLRSCRRTGDFGCLRFVPPLLAQVRAMVAQPERPRQLMWPRLGGEAARRASAASQLVRSWASSRGTDPIVVASHGMTVMMLELAPALRALASHLPIRAVAPNMMTPEEQAALRRIAGVMLHYGLRYCFEQPTPPGLQPLQLPEAVVPVSNNAIILGLTAEVQKNLAAAAAGAPGGFQRHPQQPYGGRGPGGSFQAGRGGRGQYNSYGQSRGPCGDTGLRGPPGATDRGVAGGASTGGPAQTTGPPVLAGPVRHVPLVPAIDTLHFFTAFSGAAAVGARVTVPHVVRQMISQHTEMEAIRRAEAVRMAGPGGAAPDQPLPEPAVLAPPGGRSNGPLQPVAPPPQRQMAGRMPPGAEGKKGGASGGAGVKRKGTWLDAFKQQASVKARGGVGSGASAGATARQAEQTAEGAIYGAADAAPQGGAAASGRGRLPFPVLYRFNEGYTNAVKRPLLIRELL